MAPPADDVVVELEEEPVAAAPVEPVVAEKEPEPEPAPVIEPVAPVVEELVEEEEEQEAEAFAAAIEALDKPVVPDLDDLSKSLLTVEPAPVPATPKTGKPTPTVTIARPSPADDRVDESADRKKRKKGQQLVYDENAGRTVVKRKRKSNRNRDWGDFNLDDFDEFS